MNSIMGLLVCNGAQLMCSFGAAPSALTVLPKNRVLSGAPAGNIMDNIPMANIMPFGMCISMTNPTVAAATAAAFGVLTPQPCVPTIPGPWVPGAMKTLIGGQPSLDNSCKLMCAYAGVISVLNPGQTKTIVG